MFMMIILETTAVATGHNFAPRYVPQRYREQYGEDWQTKIDKCGRLDQRTILSAQGGGPKIGDGLINRKKWPGLVYKGLRSLAIGTYFDCVDYFKRPICNI
jgi:hypothetical protein